MNNKISPAKLTVGSKVQVLDDYYGFNKGQVVELYRLEDNGVHLFKGDNTHLKHCDGQEGAYLNDGQYTVLPVASAHPHADLMLKYAQIAQYDDKPWENFECRTGLGEGWWPVVIEGFYGCYEYRLKPQAPVIQLGQIWVNPEGVIGTVVNPSDKDWIYLAVTVSGVTRDFRFTSSDFLDNFERKEGV